MYESGHWLFPWSFSTVNQAGSRCKCFEMRKDWHISQKHGTVQPLLNCPYYPFYIWICMDDKTPAASSVVWKPCWTYMTTIQSIFEERLNEHLPSQYFSTSEVIKFVICLLPIFSGRIYIIINAQLGIWRKLWLTPCLMLVKKIINFSFVLLCFFFHGSHESCNL